MLRFAKRHPWLTVKSALTGDTMATLSTPERAREYMFSARTPKSLVVDCVGGSSKRADERSTWI